MAEYRRKIQSEQSVTRSQIRMADTAGGDSHERLVRPGVIEFYILEYELGARGGSNGGTGADRHINLPA
jgi:hypothetical protein